FGESNLIAVMVDNSYRKDIPPKGGDFTIFGGLYRPVEILLRNRTCFTPLDYASGGVYILQKQVSKESAHLEILSKIDSRRDESMEVVLEVNLYTADNTQILHQSQTVNIPPHQIIDVTEYLTINNPHLWHGIKDPYLYRVEIKLFHEEEILDAFSSVVGLRFFRFDNKKGFFLNGEHYPLHGVCRHQDKQDKGYALSLHDHEIDHDFFVDIGANTVRLAHYQQSEEIYSLCDRSGILVWAENCMVNGIYKTPAFEETVTTALIELIKQAYNHPSIYCWALSNEMYLMMTPNPVPLLRKLHHEAKTLDPSRVTVSAFWFGAFLNRNIFKTSDVYGWNVYPGWYHGKPTQMKPLLKLFKWGTKNGYAMTEYGAGGSVNQHGPSSKKPKHNGHFHPEEYQAFCHEVQYAEMLKKSYVWGTYVWNLFDFSSALRKEGEFPGRNDKGLVTYDRKVKKDVYYFYRVNWNPEPMTYITSRRFVNRINAKIEVKVYSNCQSVELYVNGQKLGEMEKNPLKIFRWDSLFLSPGENNIQVVGKVAENEITDSCIWILNENKLN
ncbi:MAG: glycoside hydrolase family 2 protein, partial [Promethearchaeota archaeon]